MMKKNSGVVQLEISLWVGRDKVRGLEVDQMIHQEVVDLNGEEGDVDMHKGVCSE